MTWAVWLSFATVSAVNIITPGPANMNVMRRAVQLGGCRMAPMIFGNCLGLALGGAICAAGIASFVRASPVFWMIFQALGVVYLAWLGVKMIVLRDTLVLARQECPVIPARSLFSEAFLLAITNPKALLFYLALFPQVLDPAQAVIGQASLCVLTYCGLSILSLSVYAGLADVLRRRVMTQRRYDRFRQLSGLVLIGFAVKLLIRLE